MRKRIAHQLPLSPGFADHEHGRELAAISAILDHQPHLVELVLRDLDPGSPSSKGGRPGMTAEQVLRALVIKQMEGLSYEQLAFHLADSASFQTFCRVDAWAGPPGKSALAHNIKRVRSETLEAINRGLVAFAERAGVETGKQVRFDCTVTDANIHDPNDSLLLWDVVRVLTRTMRKAHEAFDIPFTDRTRRAKRRSVEIQNAATTSQRKRLYRDLLGATEDAMASARLCLELVQRTPLASTQEVLIATRVDIVLVRTLGLGERVIDQTRRRVLEGESVPASEKIVSIFEEHTDIIRKDRRETRYGHKICLATGRSGLVLDCEVLDGNPADSTLAVSMVERQRELYGRVPPKVAFDGGFASKRNLQEIKALGVEDAMFSKRRGLAISDMVNSTWVYRRLRNFRAGIEGVISFLKRCFGLGRCNWRGLASFKSYVQASVMTANLLVLARARLAAPT